MINVEVDAPYLLGDMRTTTDAELAVRPLVDDNSLLELLRRSGFLANDELVGYLPAAFYEETSTNEVELFVDSPVGEDGLVPDVLYGSSYQSTHQRLIYLIRQADGLHIDTGHVVETKSGNRQYLSKISSSFISQVAENEFGSKRAVELELGRLGIDDLADGEEYIDDHVDLAIKGLTLTTALREAAKWAGYTKIPPKLLDGNYYPRKLSFDEVATCLSSFVTNLKDGRTEHDITIIQNQL